ncbi:hypothetical protein [Bradyrhizobium lupini]|jgi:hypothetical protein|uniref:hypothetical protein n=1 Tax=Rhizobium lupini TaxID=136996 RepID=UPI0034C5B7EB
MLMHLFGCMAMFLGIMLIVCSRDLTTRAPLVMGEAVLRFAGFGVMAGYGLWGSGGASLIASGAFDLIVALIYLIGLPRSLRVFGPRFAVRSSRQGRAMTAASKISSPVRVKACAIQLHVRCTQGKQTSRRLRRSLATEQ